MRPTSPDDPWVQKQDKSRLTNRTCKRCAAGEEANSLTSPTSCVCKSGFVPKTNKDGSPKGGCKKSAAKP